MAEKLYVHGTRVVPMVAAPATLMHLTRTVHPFHGQVIRMVCGASVTSVAAVQSSVKDWDAAHEYWRCQRCRATFEKEGRRVS